MLKLSESQIQGQCVSWFRYHFPQYILFAVCNEATYKRSSYFSSIGMLNGVSDTVIVLPNKVLFVEFKAEKGKQRPEQKIFEEKVTALGFPYSIVRSLEEFKQVIYDAIGFNQTI